MPLAYMTVCEPMVIRLIGTLGIPYFHEWPSNGLEVYPSPPPGSNLDPNEWNMEGRAGSTSLGSM